ncbi:MAG TPA: tail fiber protein [Acidimicrobiales bacterium]|nr:tail fiber protein [Acidimicrobiales bacterium]
MAFKAPISMQADSYTAALDRQVLDALYQTPGVVASGHLVVTQRAAGANMSVDVAAGKCIITGTDASNQGKYLCFSDAVANVVLTTAPGTGLSRIDLIIAQVRDATVIGGSHNDWLVTVVKGTAASSPTAPAAPASSLVLARVLVGANVSTITNTVITTVHQRAKRTGEEVGDIRMCAYGTVPWYGIPRDGRNISRVAYPELYAKWGTAFGVGDGATTFGVGDDRNRVPIGAGSTHAAGSTGGSATTTLTAAMMPRTTVTITQGTHTHGITQTPHTHAMTATGDSAHPPFFGASAGGSPFTATGVGQYVQITNAHTTEATANISINGAVANITAAYFGSASPTPVPIVPPFRANTFYVVAF